MGADSRRESAWLLRLAVYTAVAVAPQMTLAQGEQSQMGLVRMTEGSVGADLAAAVDGALLRDLAGLAGIEHPTVSPAELADIQLTVGCQGESRACLSSVAETLQVQSLIVRQLNADAAGTFTLRLIRFEAALDQEPLAAQATATPETQAKVIEEVPRLVRVLFGLSEPATAAPAPSSLAPTAAAPSEPPPPTSERNVHAAAPNAGAVEPITWVTLAAGAAVLAGGVVLGLSARSSYEDFKHAPVETREDVHRLRSDLDALQTQGTIANVLMPVGGVLLGLGATFLILDLTGDDETERDTTVGMSPSADGVTLALRGRLGDH